MLLGVLLSVLALLLMPWLAAGHRIAFVLSGIAVLCLAAVWTSAGWRAAAPSDTCEDWQAD